MFERLKDTDPIGLPGLVFEMRWLRGEEDWNLFDQLLLSSHALIRWAVVEMVGYRNLGRYPFDLPEQVRAFNQVKEYLEKLRTDKDARVRQEAEYAFQNLHFWPRAIALLKLERRALRKEIERFKPSLTFAEVSIRFCNFLSANNKISYPLTGLEQFVDELERMKNNEQQTNV